MNIGLLIVVIIFAIIGISSSVFCILGIPVVIIQKIIRKIRFGTSMFD